MLVGATRSAGFSFARESGLSLAQGNGARPEVLLSAHAPGDHGISLIRSAQRHGLTSDGIALHHTILVSTGSGGPVFSSVGSKSGTFLPEAGTATVLPAGAHHHGRGTGDCGIFIMLIPTATLACAGMERIKAGATLVEAISVQDMELLRLSQLLGRQIEEGFVDDPLAWYELTDAVVHRLIDANLSEAPTYSRGMLDKQTIARVIKCIHANVDRPIGINEIAEAAQQTWSHFPRLFRRSTGMSPYQYVIRVRLERALNLIKYSRASLAEIAISSGFADQSHFNRWAKRMYGLTPRQLAKSLR